VEYKRLSKINQGKALLKGKARLLSAGSVSDCKGEKFGATRRGQAGVKYEMRGEGRLGRLANVPLTHQELRAQPAPFVA
jgi:hypothetical protein